MGLVAPIFVTDRCEVYGDDEDCEDQEGYEDGDDESDGDVQADGHVSSFLTFHQLMENERRYISMDVTSCDVSNNLDLEDPEESLPVMYHLAPSPRFENVENFGNYVSSDYTPWVNYNTGNLSGEFVVSQVFISKAFLQDVVKLYSIKAH